MPCYPLDFNGNTTSRTLWDGERVEYAIIMPRLPQPAPYTMNIPLGEAPIFPVDQRRDIGKGSASRKQGERQR